MKKITFNILKWFSICWMGLGTISNFFEWMADADSDAFFAFLLAAPTLWFLCSLRIRKEEAGRDEIEIVSSK